MKNHLTGGLALAGILCFLAMSAVAQVPMRDVSRATSFGGLFGAEGSHRPVHHIITITGHVAPDIRIWTECAYLPLTTGRTPLPVPPFHLPEFLRKKQDVKVAADGTYQLILDTYAKEGSREYRLCVADFYPIWKDRGGMFLGFTEDGNLPLPATSVVQVKQEVNVYGQWNVFVHHLTSTGATIPNLHVGIPTQDGHSEIRMDYTFVPLPGAQ